jgi:hypothetical protein
MKAQLKIEAIGDNINQISAFFTRMTDDMVPGLGTMTFGGKPFRYWCARIVGFDPVYKYCREFIRPKKDYSQANSKGSRGVWLYFLLESGFVYEAKSSKRRFFCEVNTDGNVVDVSKEYVDEWISEHSELVCSKLPDNE